MIMDKKGKLFGIVNFLDLSIFCVVIVFVCGYFFVKSGHSALNKVIKAEGTAEIKIVVKGAKVMDDKTIVKNDKAFITIRNQPYAEVNVTNVLLTRRKIRFMSKDEKHLIEFPDKDDPYSADMTFTIKDKASMTDDGIVMGGNKVKIGIPIELENFNYRLTGTVADISFTPESK